jgi:hypothetical protein
LRQREHKLAAMRGSRLDWMCRIARGIEGCALCDSIAIQPVLACAAVFVIDAKRNFAARTSHPFANDPVVRSGVPKQEAIAAAGSRTADLLRAELAVVAVGAFFERLQEWAAHGLGSDALEVRAVALRPWRVASS